MMSKIHRQKGFTDRTVLFAFVLLFVIAIVALPKYLKWQAESKVPPEVLSLRRIHAAQAKYRSKISLKNTYADFKQLESAQLLPECAACDETAREVDGVFLRLSRNYEETRLCVSAGIYAVDTEGKIYESNASATGCAAGEITGANLKEFTDRK